MESEERVKFKVRFLEKREVKKDSSPLIRENLSIRLKDSSIITTSGLKSKTKT
ncbi:MAG: hypothetical protein J7K98_02625 [Candidatus Aenigmarchaeota archaeon]|nr:hypothetical protein [Candidatus Aenigmarchaeota archaeon]